MTAFNLKSKESRASLDTKHEPYWHELDRGFHLGYRKAESGGMWYVRRYNGKGYIKRRLGHADDNRPADNINVLNFTQARKKATAYEDVIEHVEVQKHPALYSVSDAVREYLDWYKAHRKAYSRTKQIIGAHILPKLGNESVQSLTTARLSKWLQDLATSTPTSKKGHPLPPYATRTDTGDRTKGKGRIVYEYTALPYDLWTDEMKRKRKSSANRVFTILKAALNHAWRMDRVSDASAWQKVKPFHAVDAPRVAHLSEKEATALLNAASDDFRPLAKAALLTGCRYGELTRLQARHLNDGHLFIEETKTGKSRYVPLSAEGLKFFNGLAKGKGKNDLLLTHTSGEVWGQSHQIRPMREACLGAGIDPPVGFHVLRHTYATLLLRSDGTRGVSIRYVADLIGDSVATCEKHYGHVVRDDLQAEVSRKLPSFGGTS